MKTDLKATMSEKGVFFVVGAAKSGTSSLYAYLKKHPDIHMCPHKDVVCYFCRHYGLPVTLEEYLEMLVPKGDYTIAGDICHAYLTDNKSAAWIHEVFPEAKIIMILRNPADKAFSQYNWLVSHGYEWCETFEEALQVENIRFSKNVWKVKGLTQEYKPNYLYYRSGLYAEQIERYLNLFPKENVLFIKFDDFVRNTKDEMRKIYTFLGVSTAHDLSGKKYNVKRKVRSVRLQYFLGSKLRKILPVKIVDLLLNCNSTKGISLEFSQETRVKLLGQYRDNILRTQELTGLDLNDWLV